MDTQNRDFKGVWIPKEIWLCEELTFLDKVILIEIDSLDNEETHCIASNSYLAEFCGCTETTISTSISKLKEKGLIEQISFDGRHRVLKSRLKESLGQPLKNLKAGFKKVNAINIDSNIDNNSNNNNDDETSPKLKTFKKDIYSFIEENFGRTLAPVESEKIKEWGDSDLVRYAVKVAILHGKYNINYIDKILYSYKRNGIVSVQQAEQQAEDFENSKKKYQHKEEQHKETFEEMVARVGDEWEEKRKRKENAENRS